VHSWQSSIYIYIGPCLKVWYNHKPALFTCCLHSEIMDLYMPLYRSSPCLKWSPTLRGLHRPGVRKPSQMIISGNRLLAFFLTIYVYGSYKLKKPLGKKFDIQKEKGQRERERERERGPHPAPWKHKMAGPSLYAEHIHEGCTHRTFQMDSGKTLQMINTENSNIQ